MNGQNSSLSAGLWLVGVPIGTARDITLRALDVLTSADVLVAEDTRSLRKLMDIHGIPLNGRQLRPYHDHSRDGAIDAILNAIRSGKSVAYASEAGMPLIADPGFELVRAARAADLMVTSAPGPSAVTTALSLGGLPTDAFHFCGFLPSARKARISAMQNLATLPATLVMYESPKRMEAFLKDAVDVFGPERPARICRELTKKFEDVLGDTLDELAKQVAETPVRGECVILIDRAIAVPLSDDEIVERLKDALKTMTLRDAANHVAKDTGTARRAVYQLGISLTR